MGNVGSTMNSQGGGYGLIATKMIKDNRKWDEIDVNPKPSTWDSYDMLFVCEGVNFVEGSYNIPGGPQPEHYEKMKAIGNYKGSIFFINKKFDFEGFNQRLKIPDLSFAEGKTVDFFISYGSPGRGKAVIGDSHALSVWRPGYALDFTAGRTLHGFMKRRTPQEINAIWPLGTVTYFGTIDLRFHLMRQPDPKKATVDLFTRYSQFSKQLNDNTVIGLLPVEHESRKIPGTGLYKGKPYFGTRKERMEIRELAHKVLKDNGIKLFEWPEEWVDEDGTKMLDILESRQSVHLKPKYYPFLNEIVDQ